MRKYARLLAGATVVAGVIALACWWFGYPGKRWRFERQRTGFLANRIRNPQPWETEFIKNTRPIAVIFEGATRVECFRMLATYEVAGQSQRSNTLIRMPYSSRVPDEDAAFATRLGAIVLNPHSYTDVRKACTFNPTVGYRVWKGQDSAVVLICFGCNDLVVVQEQSYLASTKRNARFGSVPYELMKSCELSRPELLRLAREAFPNDAKLLKLDEFPRQ